MDDRLFMLEGTLEISGHTQFSWEKNTVLDLLGQSKPPPWKMIKSPLVVCLIEQAHWRYCHEGSAGPLEAALAAGHALGEIDWSHGRRGMRVPKGAFGTQLFYFSGDTILQQLWILQEVVRLLRSSL